MRFRTDLRLAFMLLSRIPVGRGAVHGDLATIVWAFPLVGGVIGLGCGTVALILDQILPFRLALLLAMAAGMLATGALHEDGMADLADGFGGGRDKEKKLAIMRDSRIGSYGVLALILTVFCRWEALALVDAGALALAWMAVGAASSAAMVLLLVLTPPARADGLGLHVASPPVSRVIAALALAFLLAIPAGITVLLCCCLALVITVPAMRWLTMRQIGGYTGDVLGATKILADLAAWIAMGAWIVPA